MEKQDKIFPFFFLPGPQAIMTLLLFVLIYGLSRQAAILTSGTAAPKKEKKPVVVIDSGHGGNDPGKIGVDDSLEKDINLEIAEKLKQYLEASDIQVVMTREKGKGLYKEGDKNKKMADMRARCKLINDTAPVLVVSIHQNSYHESSVSGGQVFYYKNSEKGKKLAEIIQKRFDFVLEENTRKAKANDSYYLLLHVKQPIVIVECGFLSNRKEAKKLASEEYQDRLAWTIHMGIMEYINTQ